MTWLAIEDDVVAQKNLILDQETYETFLYLSTLYRMFRSSSLDETGDDDVAKRLAGSGPAEMKLPFGGIQNMLLLPFSVYTPTSPNFIISSASLLIITLARRPSFTVPCD